MIITFSKDRPLQLELLLRSLYSNCSDIDFVRHIVLYKATDERIKNMYKEIEYMYYPRVKFTEESNFKTDLLKILDGEEYVLFLVDDAIIINPFKYFSAIIELDRTQSILGVSLRLNNNKSYSYMHNMEQVVPRAVCFEGICGYIWVDADLDWGYPFEISSSIYRVSDLYESLVTLPYYNPNSLESKLAVSIHTSRLKEEKRFLAFFKTGVSISNAVNMVNASDNRSGNKASMSVENLLNIFEKGWRINYEPFRGINPISVHINVDYTFMDGKFL